MATDTIQKNWEVGTTPEVLHHIHDADINISIYDRNIEDLREDVHTLLDQDIELRASGKIEDIVEKLSEVINTVNHTAIRKDIEQLLHLFKSVTKANSFRMLLATINTNMCRKFHTDINDVRMLCTYSGPGTLWLTEDNINRKALESLRSEESIAIDQDAIRHAKTGSVILLKGAVYPKEESRAVVHRSPTIEESGTKRLLLRIDTNEFLNFQ